MDKTYEDNLVRIHQIIGQRLNVFNDFLEKSVIFHLAVAESRLFRDKDPNVIAASIIYLISRKNEISYSLKELSDASRLPRKDIARCYRLLIKAKEEFKLGKIPPRLGNKLVMSSDNKGFSLICPKCLDIKLVYYEVTDVFRCSNCHASWKRFE